VAEALCKCIRFPEDHAALNPDGIDRVPIAGTDVAKKSANGVAGGAAAILSHSSLVVRSIPRYTPSPSKRAFYVVGGDGRDAAAGAQLLILAAIGTVTPDPSGARIGNGDLTLANLRV
jgi:hypothetical protein